MHPSDHQRTRLTHALEVAQVATSIARGAGVNVTLADAIALGHDCGHGPGGHASEDAFDAFVPEGYEHGPWGADVVLTPLNLCAETLDGIRNHSWSRPAPATVEGEIVSWADRIAYCAHDLEDAIHAGIVRPDDVPAEVVEICGATRREQLSTFVRAVVATITTHGEVGMAEEPAAALAAIRTFNYERIYVRPASLAQSRDVVDVLRALVEFFAAAAEPDLRCARRAGGQRRGGPGRCRLRRGHDRPIRLRHRRARLALGSGTPAASGSVIKRPEPCREPTGVTTDERSSDHDPPGDPRPSLRDDPQGWDPHRLRSPSPCSLGGIVRRARS